jgi:hypothetical protein
MMRRSVILASSLKAIGDFHIREHLLQNYEGWRVLDDPQYESAIEFWSKDAMGFVRNLDPIIDDPRLTHKQRVCRLYKWAALEMRQWQAGNNSYKFNLGLKTVRNRFEKYRYVTDPATCDMMIRETQYYLREQCYWWFLRRNPQDKFGPQCTTSGMFHPDNSGVYDHWVSHEVQLYEDAKIHRFSSHHPIYSGAGEMADRYGDNDSVTPSFRKPALIFSVFLQLYFLIWAMGMWMILPSKMISFNFGPVRWDDPNWTKYSSQYDAKTVSLLEYSERTQRMRSEGGFINYHWNRVYGTKAPNKGTMTTGSFPIV